MFFLVGVGMLGVAGLQFVRVSTFVRSARTATGRVVEFEPHRDSSGRRGATYSTIFTFTDDAGQAHTGHASFARLVTPEVGESVEVLYLANSPGQAKIRAFRTLWKEPTILGSVGVLFSTIGAFAFVARRRARLQEKAASRESGAFR